VTTAAALDHIAPAPPAEPGFDWLTYLCSFDERLLTSPEGRRTLTRHDPLLWALLYFRHHLRSSETGDRISFSQFHLDLCERAKRWARKDLAPGEIREAWVAPRGSGKSSWLFLILPLWALAHGHRSYVMAFTDSGGQGEQHLTSVKGELDGNTLLRRDFPNLCRAAARHRGATVADNRALFIARSGAVFSAKGIDSSSLGAKVGNKRPDLLLFDDVEPDASNYSTYQKEKRLATILNAVLPMNDRAVVQIVGTTTMTGSIIHDLVKTVTLPGEEPAEWITDEGLVTYLYPAIEVLDDGTERSMWPQRWPLDYLQSIRHTRAYRLNYANDPMAADGDYWGPEDFTYRTPVPLTAQLLSIDPAVTSKKKSDYTALAVIGYSKPRRECMVRYGRAFRISPGEELRRLVLRTLEAFPDISGVVIETNQGGDAWRAILHGLPVPIKTVHQSEPKEVRAARLLNHYQRRRVVHEQRLHAVEEQMIGFPKAPNDDLVDAVGTGVTVFLGRKRTAGVTTASYVA
jgi:phage terminase large subunit-like protein